MIERIRQRLAARKGYADPSRLAGWNARELAGLGWMLTCRAFRGIRWRLSFRCAGGLILCERGVRILHPWHITAGRELNLEEGCEIVGLSKRGVVFGRHCTVGRFATIRPTNVLVDELGEGLRMGDNSNIGSYAYIGCSGYIEIGQNVMMGPRVALLAENHHFERTDVPMIRQGVERKTIRIADDCWLGAGCIVLAGVNIGTGVVVAAGAVVARDVPPYTVVAGVPARVVRSRQSVAASTGSPLV